MPIITSFFFLPSNIDCVIYTNIIKCIRILHKYEIYHHRHILKSILKWELKKKKKIVAYIFYFGRNFNTAVYTHYI